MLRHAHGGVLTFASTCAKICYAQGWRFLYCSAKFLKGTGVAFVCLSPGDRLGKFPLHCRKRKTLLSWDYAKSQDANYVTCFVSDAL
jgi:hypothetical protein